MGKLRVLLIIEPQRLCFVLRHRFFYLCVLFFAQAALCSVTASAEEAEEEASWYSLPQHWSIEGWNIQTSLYTRHFDPDPDHNNNQRLIGIEARFDRQWLGGIALFDNSFGQNSQMIYLGKYWTLFGSEHWYGKLTAGLLHGYKEPYEDKIPFNSLGIAPVIIPSLGFRYRWFLAEANLAGLAAVTLTAGITF